MPVGQVVTAEYVIGHSSHYKTCLQACWGHRDEAEPLCRRQSFCFCSACSARGGSASNKGHKCTARFGLCYASCAVQQEPSYLSP